MLMSTKPDHLKYALIKMYSSVISSPAAEHRSQTMSFDNLYDVLSSHVNQPFPLICKIDILCAKPYLV